MVRVPVKPEILEWACERAGVGDDALAKRFPKLVAWQRGEAEPTFKQLENFAKATYTPIGYFFLSKPPTEAVPIPDFRTIKNASLHRPSPHLLDTIYLCQRRQDWYHQHAQLMGEPSLSFIGSATTDSDVEATASDIRETLQFDNSVLSSARDMSGAIRILLDKADDVGILVMVNGIVGNNTHRPLDPGEFRGFALVDPLAPLIFVNGADTKAAQMFTLAHELAHLWLGESGVSDTNSASMPRVKVERWCNAVAAETLVPIDEFKKNLRPHAELWAETRRLASKYRVSTLVVLRRMKDARRLTATQHNEAYEQEAGRLRQIMRDRKKSSQGKGDFYHTVNYRLGARFASAVVTSTWEGRSTFTEAFRLLGCRNVKTLEKIGGSLGLANPAPLGGDQD